MPKRLVDDRQDPAIPLESLPLLEELRKTRGPTPNVLRSLSLSPQALRGFLSLQTALESSLTPRIRDFVALAVSQVNGCRYCLAAHSFNGVRNHRLSDTDVREARVSALGEVKERAAAQFAASVTRMRGKILPVDLQLARNAGFSDGELIEIIALVAQYSLTNLVNNVFDTPLDYSLVESFV
jgi:uncharacterized peroxidase-related enzyme